MNDLPVVIVSGIPRSGTSMMMQMLAAGGMDLLCDDVRPADIHNPHGYFELEKVKNLENDNSWLADHKDQALKVLFHLLRFLPQSESFQIIFMLRDMDVIINSQNKMLKSYNKPFNENENIRDILSTELRQIKQWLKKQENIQTLFIDYNETLTHTRKACVSIENFLNRGLNLEKMKTVVTNRQPKPIY